MNTSFERLHRELGRVTFGVLLAGLAFFGLALVSALLGFPHSVASFRSVAASIAVVFVALFGLFLVASVAGAVIHWLDRRSVIRKQGA